MKAAIARDLAAAQPGMVALRRDLHAHPEASFDEHRTSALIAERLHDAGLAVTTGIAETGVIGLVEGSRPGKTLAIRADIDALPIDETSESSYRSKNPGLMHA